MEYVLKNKSGEIINKIKVTSMEEAIQYFSRIKNLSVDDLLNLFNIEPV
jgi:hypothetical protein